MSRERIDYQKIAIDLGIGIGLAVVCFGLGALVLWPFGKAILGAKLAMGFCLFLPAVVAALLGAVLVHKVFRMDSDPPRDPFTITNIIFSAFVQAGWAAFVALAVRGLTPDASLFGTIILLFIGLVASWVGSATTEAFFQGSIYKTINALLSLAGYVVFAAWPGAARALYGWFFAWF